jgi:ABC-type antimicrobial peptide transport system permease subunit
VVTQPATSTRPPANYRDERGLLALDDLAQDVRYALRQLWKAPIFTLAATMSLALGIGASAAVFTVIERVLLRPLPVSNARELVYVTDERILTQASPRFSYPLVPGDKGSSPVREELGPALAVLMALTGLAMGLACINVASLVSVRSAAREQEMAIRLSLGAWRARLTRQLLTEGLVLAALGGAAGLLVAPWAARLLVAS